MTNHYLSVPGNEWEYTENDRVTGRPVRRKFTVPRLLSIADPQDWTNRWGNKDNEEGEIIVCYEGRGEPKDIVFLGEPSPDMQPVDDEATVISESLAKKWETRPDHIPGDYSQSLIDKFQIAMADAKPAEVKGMDDLISAMTTLMKQNAEIMAAMAAVSQPQQRRA